MKVKDRKTYRKPDIKTYGDLIEITTQYGNLKTDLPKGSPANGPGGCCGS